MPIRLVAPIATISSNIYRTLICIQRTRGVHTTEDHMRQKTAISSPDHQRIFTIVMYFAVLSICIQAGILGKAKAATSFQGTLNSVSITDSSGENTPPYADIAYTQDGDTFTFDASHSNDSDGEVVQYKWDFGDGQTSESVTATHNYETKSTYNISLTIIDNKGAVTISQTVVSNKPEIILAEQLSENSETNTIRLKKTIGQSFYLESGATIESITVKSGSSVYNSSPVKIRVGLTNDLSNDFIGESETVIINQNSTEYTFTFTTPVTLSSDTQYYFTISVTNEVSSNYTNFKKSSSDVYSPSGCATCGHIYGDNVTKWAATQYIFNNDLYFIIKGQ